MILLDNGFVTNKQTDGKTLGLEEESNGEQSKCQRPFNTLAAESCVKMVSPTTATGNLDPGSLSSSPTSPPCLTQWDHCDGGCPGLSGSLPHLEPQSSISTLGSSKMCYHSSSKPALLDETSFYDLNYLTENLLPPASAHGCCNACSSSDSSYCSASVSNQPTEKPLVTGVSPSGLDPPTLLDENTVSVIGEPEVWPVTEENVNNSGSVDVGLGGTRFVSKACVSVWKSCSCPDMLTASRTMPVPVTNTSAQETRNLGFLLSKVDGK